MLKLTLDSIYHNNNQTTMIVYFRTTEDLQTFKQYIGTTWIIREVEEALETV